MKRILSFICAAAAALSAMSPAVLADGNYTSDAAFISYSFDDALPEELSVVPAGRAAIAEVEGEKCLKVSTVASAANSANVYILNKTESSTASTVSANGIIEVSASYFFDKPLTDGRQLVADLYSNASTGRACNPYNFRDNRLCRANSDTALCEYPTEKWFRLKFTIMPTGDAGAFCRLDMTCDGVTTKLYEDTLTAIGAGANFPNSAVSIWQHDLLTKGTQNGESDEVCYYIDDIRVECKRQATGIDEDFDNAYYRAGTSPSKATFAKSAAGLDITVADTGDEEHKNALKFTGVVGAISNVANHAAAVSKANGNTIIFEYDQYSAQATAAGKMIFPALYTGEANASTSGASNYTIIPFCICGDGIYTQLSGKGELLGTVPVGEWFKMRLVYTYGSDFSQDVVTLQMIDKDGARELYSKTRANMAGYLTQYGKHFPVGGVGNIALTVTDNTAGNTYFFDNFKLYSTNAPTAENLHISGTAKKGETIRAEYDFTASDGGTDASEIKWYRSDEVSGGSAASKTEVAQGREYTVSDEDAGKYLILEVLAKSSGATSAVTPTSYVITVPDFEYDFENGKALEAVFKPTVKNAGVSLVSLDGNTVGKFEATGAGGANIQNITPYAGLCGGTVCISSDLMFPEVPADGTSILMQLLTAGSTSAGTYINAFWIKPDGIYASDGAQKLAELPVGEWFTVRCAVEIYANKPVVTLWLGQNGSEMAIDSRSFNVNGISTAGIKYIRLSYGCAADGQKPVYFDNIGISASELSGIYDVKTVQKDGGIEYSARLVDYTGRKGVLILRNTGDDDMQIGIEYLDKTKSEETVSVTLDKASLDGELRTFVWEGFDTMVPILSDR